MRIVCTAEFLLPRGRVLRDKLYHDLNRCKSILDDGDLLGTPLHSFGKMRKAKFNEALLHFVKNVGCTILDVLALFHQVWDK